MSLSPPYYPYKSLAVGILLAISLGPVGLLYASFWGGIFMIVIGLIVVPFKFTFPIVLVWLVCAIWSARVIEKYNKKIDELNRPVNSF